MTRKKRVCAGRVRYWEFQTRRSKGPEGKDSATQYKPSLTVDSEWFCRTFSRLKFTLLFTGNLLMVGCTNTIHIPLDGTPLSKDQSTVVVWMDQKPMLINEDVPIFLDRREVGKISAKVPLKFKTSPGHHTLHGSLSGIIIDRAIDVDLKPGEASFYRTYMQCGMWVCSVYTSPTEPSSYYDSVIHKFHDD